MIVGGKKKSGETCREIKWVQEASHGSLSIGHLVHNSNIKFYFYLIRHYTIASVVTTFTSLPRNE